MFGGTFDPPHNGHMAILQNAIAACVPHKVVIMPAGMPPHKQASATPAALRLAMCECFRPLFGNMDISRMEVDRQGKSYSYDTVQQLLAQNPGAHISLCIGGDMLLSFTEWRNWQQLLRLVTLVVQGRMANDSQPIAQAAKKLAAQGANIVFTNGLIEEVSSTQVRRMVRQGKSVAGLVPPLVEHIIRENRLYKETP